MGIGHISQKAVLLSKTIGQKRGLSPLTEDIYRFVNKKGEQNVFTIFRDERNIPVKKLLKNETTGVEKVRHYTYKTYKFKNGETVPYKIVTTNTTNGLSVKERTTEIIATAQNGSKIDVPKTKSSFIQQEANGNRFEKSSILRFSNGQKPVGVISNIERTQDGNIISKKTVVHKTNGEKAKIISDLFYNTATYDDISFKSEIIKALKSEMGLKDYGITVKPAHIGYTTGRINTYARYEHKSKTVSLNVDVPAVNQRKQFASEIAHELTHAWQFREMELLEQGLLSGARKEAAQIYKNEISNYIKGSATDKAQHAAYKAQVVETKAREFQKFVEQYYKQNLKNIYNRHVQGIIPPQIGITAPLPVGALKDKDIL